MIAAHHDITIDRAADWSLVLTIKDAAGIPIDITSDSAYIFTGDIRNKKTKIEKLSFSFSKESPVAPADGEIKVYLTAVNSQKLEGCNLYEYDIFMTTASEDEEPIITKTRILEGTLTSRNNITN